jgi:hypothetical protein
MELWWGNLLGNVHLEDEDGRETKVDLWGIGCEDGNWIKLAWDYVHWWALELVVLDFPFQLPQCLLHGSNLALYVTN